jgi:hypothetical protein
MKTMSAKMMAASVLALFAAQTANAERPQCIEEHDMRTLIRMALPAAIEGLADHCKAALPADAFLPNEGPGLAQRFRYEAPVDPNRARAAIEAATGKDLSSFASSDTVMQMARQFVGAQIAERVPLKDCKTVDKMMEFGGALKASAMSEAILMAMEIAGPERTKGLAICPPRDDMPGR